jgi:membrane protein
MATNKRGSFLSNYFGLFKQTFSEWLEDKAPQLGAALAYYTVFSLAPLILVLLAILFGAEFTQVYACKAGRGVEPDEHAIRLETKEIERPGGS